MHGGYFMVTVDEGAVVEPARLMALTEMNEAVASAATSTIFLSIGMFSLRVPCGLLGGPDEQRRRQRLGERPLRANPQDQ